jgi:hypothetical protein
MLGVAIPTSMAVLAIGSGAAWAQTTYILEGSDTLSDVIKNAIIHSGAALSYNNIGSGQAEKNMQGAGGTGHPTQGIGPMSRNFVASVLSAHPTWQPTQVNVVALDAGIVSVGTNQSSYCQDLDCNLTANASGENVCDGKEDLSIVLAGYPAAGFPTSGVISNPSTATTAECADSRRLAALARITSCQAGNRIDHIYRRDDKSGTQDTFREKLGFAKWCNGRSEGNYDAPGSNLYNEDLDPIRRPCIGSGSTKSLTRCTFYPLNYPLPGDPPCSNGDTLAANSTHNPLPYPVQCTQGLIVALSEGDPDGKTPPSILDITKSIGQRVSSDLNAYTMGLAGLASTDFPNNTGTRWNGTTYEYPNIRDNYTFLLSRKLWLQRNPAGSGDPGRDTEENKLFVWATNRCNLMQWVQAAGFLPPLTDYSSSCSEDCGGPDGTASGNIACAGYSIPGAGTPKMNIGATGELCGTTTPTGVTTGYPWESNAATCAVNDTAPPIPAQVDAYACSNANGCSTSGDVCCIDSTLKGGTCKPAASCPVPPGSYCTTTAQCAGTLPSGNICCTLISSASNGGTCMPTASCI